MEPQEPAHLDVLHMAASKGWIFLYGTLTCCSVSNHLTILSTGDECCRFPWKCQQFLYFAYQWSYSGKPEKGQSSAIICKENVSTFFIVLLLLLKIQRTHKKFNIYNLWIPVSFPSGMTLLYLCLILCLDFYIRC